MVHLTDSVIMIKKRTKRGILLAQQRASVLWLLSKAYNNKIPPDLREPYYRDHEDQDRLKPQIIQGLASAELYCLALANIYADPNYHKIDHHGIQQALMRKMVYLVEPPDTPLTKTVLLQTAPLRMNAHMAVIEGIMALYIKEILIPEKVVEVCSRFSPVSVSDEFPEDPEDSAILWLNKCCFRMRQRIEEELGSYQISSSHEPQSTIPSVPVIEDLADLSDGCSLACLLAFYCPGYLHWKEICLLEPMSLADSLYNLQVVEQFCRQNFPHDIYFFSLEDMLYMHSSIRQNILAFISDLMFLFEIRPVKGVIRPGIREKPNILIGGPVAPRVRSRRNLQDWSKNITAHQSWSSIPGLQSSANAGSTGSLPELHKTWSNGDRMAQDRFPKRNLSGHRISAPIATSSILRTQSADFRPQQAYSREEPQYADKRYSSDEDDDLEGYYERKPLGYEKGDFRRQPSSLSAGGFHRKLFSYEPLMPAQPKHPKEQINSDTKIQEMGEEHEGGVRISYSPQSELEKYVESDKNYITHSDFNHKQCRSSETKIGEPEDSKESSGLEDYYNQLASEAEVEELTKAQTFENDNRFSENRDQDLKQELSTTSFAQLSKLKENQGNSFNVVYMQQEKDNINGDKSTLKSSLIKSKEKSLPDQEKRTTFAVLPNTTTWQQQHRQQRPVPGSFSPQGDSGVTTPTEGSEATLASQLSNIRLALEDRRRKIEQDKKRMEILWKNHRQRLGKAAFLQAISRGGTATAGTPDSGTGREEALVETPSSLSEDTKSQVSGELSRQLSAQELAEDVDTMKKKWLNQNGAESEATDVGTDENLSPEDFQKSVEQINNSLTEVNADIAKLTQQQNINQQMDKEKFFLRGQGVFQQPQQLGQRLHPDQVQQHFQQILRPDQVQQQFQQRLYPDQFQQSFQQTLQQVPAQQMMHPYGNISQQMRRDQWGKAVQSGMIDQLFASQQQPQWGQPMVPTMPQQQHWQSPSVMMHGRPYMDQQTPGFSLHPPQTNYQYPIYQNGLRSGDQNFQPYSGIPAHPMHCQGMSYTCPPASLPNLQQPQQPFQLHDQTVSNAPTFLPRNLLTTTQQESIQATQPVPEPAVEISKSNFQQKDVTPPRPELDNFGRPIKGSEEQPSSPSRPQIGKTFRVPKSKVVSPPPSGLNFETEVSVDESEQLSTQPIKSGLNFETEEAVDESEQLSTQPIKSETDTDKGFYISFDDKQPKKPKPKLRPRTLKSQVSSSKVQPLKPQVVQVSSTRNESEVLPPAVSGPKEDQLFEPEDEKDTSGVGFVIGAEMVHPDPNAETEMQKKKEMIMIMSLRRRAEQETKRVAKEQENARKKEQERTKKEMQERKKEEEKQRREKILEQYRQRKALEEAEKEGLPLPAGSGGMGFGSSFRDTSSRSGTFSKSKPRSTSASRPRPKSVHVSNHSQELASFQSLGPGGVSQGSQRNLPEGLNQDDVDSLYGFGGLPRRQGPSPSHGYYGSRYPTSPSQPPPSLLPGIPSGRSKGSGPPSDGASDAGSTSSSAFTSEFSGPKLFVKPTAKSNRGIITNAINTVLAGAVNSDTKKKVIEAINSSESKHFLILFRDSGCQFRAIYSYNPDQEEVLKLYGTGPKILTDPMMNRFYKYNSGGKCFSQVHTKHLTVTIDAVTIHNSIWQGKKGIPPKKDLL
ncbi:patronin-like isoform X2 [Tachypleus tridentatus]|uniref:patronin-like isoform X2 n=1 Tax=Tachypleus tridentatus TaxID=6853 RepID=UPI003FD0F819